MGKLKIIVFLLVAVCSFDPNDAQQTLKALAETHHKYFGTAVLKGLLEGADYAKIVDREFDFITPGNEMKWDATESVRGQFHFEQAEWIVAHAAKHNQKVRGHTLVWHSQLAKWVTDGHFNKTELLSIMKTHISNVAGHWKGRLYSWDVINEPFNEDGTFRDSVFFKTLGKSYLAEALKFAHETDPTAKLYINDYNVEGINSKSTALYNLVKELKAEKVPIHGVGLQAHLISGEIPQDIQKNIERFAALDVDVAITELDIRIKMPDDAAKLEQQAKDYAAVVKACVTVPRCVGITVWGVTDKDSWIPSVFPEYGSALLYDQHGKEKLAYSAAKQALTKH